jgi:hypothetical protein
MILEIFILLTTVIVGVGSFLSTVHANVKYKNLLFAISTLSIFTFFIYLSSLIIVYFDENKNLTDTIREVTIETTSLLSTTAVLALFTFFIFMYFKDKKRLLDWLTGKI